MHGVVARWLSSDVPTLGAARRRAQSLRVKVTRLELSKGRVPRPMPKAPIVPAIWLLLTQYTAIEVTTNFATHGVVLCRVLLVVAWRVDVALTTFDNDVVVEVDLNERITSATFLFFTGPDSLFVQLVGPLRQKGHLPDSVISRWKQSMQATGGSCPRQCLMTRSASHGSGS